MALSLQNFTSLVQNMAAAVQSSASSLLNLTAGSVLRAILEANASVALWLQWLILQVMTMTRLATSAGTDVDTWVGDFGLSRLPAVPASGPAVFSRYSTAAAAFIQAGAQVKTSDGTRIFQVIPDAANSAWNGSTGFVLPAGVTSLTCTVVDVTTNAAGALAVGAAGNIQAGALGLLASAISGVDTVSNIVPFTNGADAQSDAALRAQFTSYIQTRSRGTPAAVAYAISTVQTGLSWTIQENVTTGGAYNPGNFVVTVDDGTGAPPSSLIAAVGAAIALYRPVGSTWTVLAPSIVSVTVTMTITTNPTTNKPALLPTIQAAVLAYIDTLPDGAWLPYSRLAMIAYLVDPSIVDVTSVLVNGATVDIVPTAGQVIKATSASVTIS